MDGCNSVHTQEILDRGYKYFGKQLNNSGRQMIYSCSWPDYIRLAGITVNYTDIGEHCNIWRMYNDVQDDWGSVLNIIDWVGDNQEVLIQAAGPGHFNDPDSLIIGNFALSVTQAESQMALYSIMAAPLLMGNDLRNLDPKYKAILLSKEVIAINQDPLGIQGRRLVHTPACGGNNYYDVWSKPLYNGDLAVLFWNRCPYGVPEKMTVDWKTLGIKNDKQIMAVRDLYQEKDLGNFTGSMSLYVDIDGVRMLRLRKFGK
jgi:alpha-N-acetylgalactosaminidase